MHGRIFVDQRGARTAINLANPADDAIATSLTLRDLSGNQLSTGHRRIGPRQSLLLFVDELFPELVPGFTGSLTFETEHSDDRLAGVALRQRRNARGETIFSTLPVADLSAQDAAEQIVFPLVTAGGGFSTQLVLVNRTDRRITGLIELKAPDGSALEMESSYGATPQLAYEIEPNGIYHAGFGSRSGAKTGYAVVRPAKGDAIPWGSVIFQSVAGESVVSEAGAEAKKVTRASRIFVDNASGRSALAIVNPNEQATKVTFQLSDGNGAFDRSGKRDLPAGTHLSMFVDDLFSDLPKGFVGFVDLTAPLPLAAVAVKMTANPGADPVLAVLPSLDLADPRALDRRPVVLPEIEFGSNAGRLSTQLISLDANDPRVLGETAGLYKAPGSRPGVPLSVSLPPCDVNPIVCENSKPGNPKSEWDITGLGDASIQGFASEISVNKGEVIYFKVGTSSRNYRLDIYRLGYYGGSGARKITTIAPSASLPQNQHQPSCLSDVTTGLFDCGNWAVSASWPVPPDAVSGVYIARLVRQDGSGVSHIVFVVRDDSSTSDLLFQTSDTTWQAYNNYGGRSLYTTGPAYKVSYNRPFTTRDSSPGTWLFGAEYPMIRFLEANGYDVSYSTGIDTDRRGLLIRQHKIFLSVGHDEYWSAAQRSNVEAARNGGVNLAFFSGNEIFWKTRWENSIDGSNSPYKTLVCYKETHANAKIDPSPVWTGTWRDPRFSPPADGGRPENALTGTLYMVNGSRADAISVPAAFSQVRLWRNTSIASLSSGQTATLPLAAAQ